MRFDLDCSSPGNQEREVRNGDDATDTRYGVTAKTSYGKSLEPPDSMDFESKEDAFKFYRQHASSLGFSAIIKASRRSRVSGKFIDAKFVCTRYGRKPGNFCLSELTDSMGGIHVKKKRGRISRSGSKTDCKGCMHVKRRQDGRWIVSSFVGEHNHDLFLTSTSLHQHNIYALNPVGVKRKGMSMSMSLYKLPSGTQKAEHQRSTGSSSSTLPLGFQEGDIQDLLEYFSFMQDENPYFFYALDFNSQHHLKNIFWVDAKGRVDYSNFGDVVLFDTTYGKDEFKLLVPFVGINNHFQFLILGCALVADDSRSNYVWLLRSWLRSMQGRAPKVILTKQDPDLKEAIAEVLPGSRHCFCLWHILSAVQEKLCYVIRKNENFVDRFHKCILKSHTEAKFEKRWSKLVDRFDLGTDKWIQSLYDDRLRWVPTFMKDVMSAGLSPRQCLGNIASRLDKCLLRKSSLKDFLHQYNTILQEKYEDEAKADFASWQKPPILKSPSPYGKQMSTLYTHAVFKRFQVEVLGVVACHPKIESKDGATTTFEVQDFEENQVYQVTWNEETSETSCTCRMFEYNGFLCRHVMLVLQISGVNCIPPKYISKRWTKDAKNQEAMKHIDFIESNDRRYSDFCQHACKLGDEGSLSLEKYKFVFAAVEEALRKCESINRSVLNTSEHNASPNEGLHEFEEENPCKSVSNTNKEPYFSEEDKEQLHRIANSHDEWYGHHGHINDLVMHF